MRHHVVEWRATWYLKVTLNAVFFFKAVFSIWDIMEFEVYASISCGFQEVCRSLLVLNAPV